MGRPFDNREEEYTKEAARLSQTASPTILLYYYMRCITTLHHPVASHRYIAPLHCPVVLPRLGLTLCRSLLLGPCLLADL